MAEEGIYLDLEDVKDVEKLVDYANTMRGEGAHGVAVSNALWTMLEMIGIFKCTRCDGFKLIEIYFEDTKVGPSLIGCPTCLEMGWTRTKVIGPWNGARHDSP